ncbi:uncharacterized protein B0P05DRAFT_570205 [Gilbertella persicaria]|nr:uncharacterized protein B0P05DRAFT_570205 [Gilbertella persicaria]KAI8084238.1 hypothetical protein B0P05DRAFT_570205 [Gilbertella persicaria]
MGIEDIANEYLVDRSNLYTDLDQLERSVEAEFEQYLNQARSFPFHKDLRDASVHSDRDILGSEILDQMKSDSHVSHPSGVDEHYNVRPLRNTTSKSRSISPGAYFGARSLPLSSIDRAWLKQNDLSSTHLKTETESLLTSRFKSLPKSIQSTTYHLPKQQHTYTQTHPATQPCHITPSSLQFECQVTNTTIYAKVAHLTLTNPNPDPCTYSLFSAHHRLTCETGGTVPPHTTLEVPININAHGFTSYQHTLSDTLLVLIGPDQVHTCHVTIDFIVLEDLVPKGRPKCRYCAIEQGYPLHHQ